MEQDRRRVEEDLRGIVSGDVLCDDASRGLYATDGSLFEVWPLAVVRPRTVDDIASVVRWAAEEHIPVHARGAGSSVAGLSLGRGVVIDCSRFLRRIVATGDGTVRVQAGVVGAALEDHLAHFHRLFGPDPANRGVTTVGGMIGRNTSGSRLARFGDVRSRLLSAQVVLSDGSIVEVEPSRPRFTQPDDAAPDRMANLAAGVAAIVAAGRETIAAACPSTRSLHGGYRLDGLERDGLVDLPKLLAGAEGTLGIITEATLATAEHSGSSAVGLILFDSIEKAAEAALRLRGLGPSACDLFDKRHLMLARKAKVAFDLLIPPVADAGLLVEFTAAEPRQCQAKLDEALRVAQGARWGSGRLSIDARRAEDAFDAELFWELSRNLLSTVHEVRGQVRPVAFIEDIVIPPPALPEFLRRLQDVQRREAATAMLFAHANHGQLHVRTFADPRAPGEHERLERLADAVYADVVAVGGTIGGEQGLGLSRTGFFQKHFPEFAAVCSDVKRLFDPFGVLNPGKIVPPLEPEDEAAGPPVGFRPALQEPETSALPILHWPDGGLVDEVDACNGCGACRGQGPTTRMCPRYRENPAEEASPRAKANLMAAFLAGRLDAKALEAEAVRTITDTCFNCHQCRIDCSAAVDIPAIVMQLKGAQVAANGLRWTPWMLSRADTLSALGGAVRPLANAALANPQARWLIEKLLGVARGRKLPPFAGNQLLRWAARRGLTRPSRRSGPRVLYFLDTFARRHDPLLAQSFVAVLERNGIGVFIDPRQVAAGMPLISEGDLDGARRLARTNMRVLAEAVRLGYRIVCTEPAAVTCIRHDYPLLVEDDDMQRVIDNTCDAASFLWELHREGRLRLDLNPVSGRLLYHAPCHTRLGTGTSHAEHLLRLIPGLALDATDHGCSGMAGTFGLARQHYRASLRAGLGLVTAVRGGGIDAGATECSACRLQMEQGTSKPTVHPIKLLAKSYGLLLGGGPTGLDTLLTTPSGRLTTST
ncbi:MAG: FAD-binding protein [Planctomycetota bacterium]|nr:FAD-binding protein [Planctomycetota bacterium]